MRRGLLLLLLVALPAMAGAHETGAPHEEAGWALDPSITIPLALVGFLYLAGVAGVWRRAGTGRGVSWGESGAFVLGMLTLVVALVSPLHELSERSFALHMVEHELLMVIAAPLLAFASPGAALVWGLPKAWRGTVGAVARTKLAPGWRWATQPLQATVIHGVAIWLWHVPALFAAALSHEAVHWVQHASFLGTGLMFWVAMFRIRRDSLAQGIAVADLFVTSIHTGLLGAILVVSRKLWFVSLGGAEIPLGLTPLEDQQLAGLIMWVPGGIVYAAAALYFAGLWIASSSRDAGKGFDHAV
jgi:cytochrome c oxidase assembly factor CtaG